jgi:multidrug transporter EmrE-like cation transporter
VLGKPESNKQKRMSLMVYILIGSTIIFTVGGQLLVKFGMSQVGKFPVAAGQILPFFWKALTNWKVFLGLLLAVFAAVTWMGAISLSNISAAYPFMGLAIVLVLALSPIFFKEDVRVTQWIGVLVVCAGLFITTR